MERSGKIQFKLNLYKSLRDSMRAFATCSSVFRLQGSLPQLGGFPKDYSASGSILGYLFFMKLPQVGLIGFRDLGSGAEVGPCRFFK